MIFDSVVWKYELEKKVADFKTYISDKSALDEERFGMKVEEFFFVTAFIVRKLLESYKFSDEYCAKQYTVIGYQRKKDDYAVDFLNNHKIDKHFDLESSEPITCNLNNICNLLIHSFIFIMAVDDSVLDGIFVTTDYDKEKFILKLSLSEYLRLLEGCINDDIIRMDYNRTTGRLVKSSNYGED